MKLTKSKLKEIIKEIDTHIHPADFMEGEIPDAPSISEYYRPEIKIPK